MPAGTPIKLRRGTASEATSTNPVLRAGEPGYETDTFKLKIGDGVTAWNSLAYFASDSTSAFTDLTDAPSSYTGAAGKLVAVNGTEDGLEFIATPSSVHAGTATLSAGTVTVSAAWVTPDTVVTVTAQTAPGTAGTNLNVDPDNHVEAVSFQIDSDDVTDTRAVFWIATEPTEAVESGFVLKSDAGSADAYLHKDLGSDQGEVWVTFDLAFEQPAIDVWDASAFGSGYFCDLQNADPTEILAIDITNALEWEDQGIGGGTNAVPAPAASTWQHCEFHYDGTTALTELYIDTNLVLTATGSPDPALDIRHVIVGQIFAVVDPDEIAYLKNVKIGTTREGSEILSEDFSTDLSAWDVTGNCTIVPDPF